MQDFLTALSYSPAFYLSIINVCGRLIKSIRNNYPFIYDRPATGNMVVGCQHEPAKIAFKLYR